mmetsp:Transcript_9686/g.18811  ORF Transcript_9686/g.18811 Transcript_9686/m.18811 type:complete len:273 (-) Transcript_9686:492-1310(-)
MVTETEDGRAQTLGFLHGLDDGLLARVQQQAMLTRVFFIRVSFGGRSARASSQRSWGRRKHLQKGTRQTVLRPMHLMHRTVQLELHVQKAGFPRTTKQLDEIVVGEEVVRGIGVDKHLHRENALSSFESEEERTSLGAGWLFSPSDCQNDRVLQRPDVVKQVSSVDLRDGAASVDPNLQLDRHLVSIGKRRHKRTGLISPARSRSCLLDRPRLCLCLLEATLRRKHRPPRGATGRAHGKSIINHILLLDWWYCTRAPRARFRVLIIRLFLTL